MSPPADLEDLPPADLKVPVLAQVSQLERTVVAQRDEIARLKGMPPRPTLKPSGLETATQAKPVGVGTPRQGGGKKITRRVSRKSR